MTTMTAHDGRHHARHRSEPTFRPRKTGGSMTTMTTMTGNRARHGPGRSSSMTAGRLPSSAPAGCATPEVANAPVFQARNAHMGDVYTHPPYFELKSRHGRHGLYENPYFCRPKRHDGHHDGGMTTMTDGPRAGFTPAAHRPATVTTTASLERGPAGSAPRDPRCPWSSGTGLPDHHAHRPGRGLRGVRPEPTKTP